MLRKRRFEDYKENIQDSPSLKPVPFAVEFISRPAIEVSESDLDVIKRCLLRQLDSNAIDAQMYMNDQYKYIYFFCF
jgi:hypothetical protein